MHAARKSERSGARPVAEECEMVDTVGRCDCTEAWARPEADAVASPPAVTGADKMGDACALSCVS